MLTERERDLIVRRAAGEYACIPLLKIIKRPKNPTPEDKLYYEFLRVVTTKSLDVKRYERLQQEILERHPHPFGAPLPEPGLVTDEDGLTRLAPGWWQENTPSSE